MKLLLCFVFLLLSIHANGKVHHSFIPSNEHLRPLQFAQSGISEQQYHEILDRIEEVYKPVYAKKGLQLIIHRDWENPEVNAGALPIPMSGKAELWFPGGLPRYEGMTADAFTLIACHEVGHQVGGMPHSGLGFEGQSDYFATLKCMRFVFEGADNLAALENKEISPFVQQKCQKNFNNDESMLICLRSSMASLDAVMVIKSLKKEENTPNFETPDTDIVGNTLSSYPSTQCRLDTYFAGALCKVNKSTPVSNSDADVGACTHSEHQSGMRPLCWYKPRINFQFFAKN